MAEITSIYGDLRGRVGPDAAQTYALDARLYTDPAIAEAEREKIFFKTWHWVCHSSELAKPGSYVAIEIFDQPIVVVRGADDVIRAFYNVCSHRGHELLKGRGTVNTRTITCPYHAWAYRLDGRLRAARGSDKVEEFDAAEFALREVRVESFAEFIFVNLEPDAVPLAEQAPDLLADIESFAPDLDQLTHAHRITYRMEANWKIVVDNFLECYHCPVAHPAFVDLVDMASYRVRTFGIWSSHHAGVFIQDNPAYDVKGATVQDHAVWWLWPNICFLRFPGSGNMMVLHILPDGAGGTFETYDFYFEAPEPTAQQWDAIKYVDEVLQPEDIGIVESVQRGLRTRGYRPGRLIVDPERSENSEHGLHHFHSLILDALEG